MSQELVILEPATPLQRAAQQVMIPATVADAGERAAHRFIEFFTANIRNPNTRRAYHRAALAFFAWTQGRSLPLGSIRPPHVAAYVEEQLASGQSRPSAKQSLAALRMLFDWLVVDQVSPSTPPLPSGARGTSCRSERRPCSTRRRCGTSSRPSTRRAW